MEKLKIDSFVEYSFLSDLKYSPDGNKLCLRVTEADNENNEYHSQLWIYHLLKDQLYQLTAGENDGKFVWRDSENIIFISERQEKEEDSLKPHTQFYQININGGEATHLVNVPFSVNDFKIDSNENLIFTAFKDLKERSEEELKENKDYEVLEEIPFWANGQGFTNSYRNHLFRVDLDDEEVVELVGDNYNIHNFTILDDKICLNMNTFTDKATLYSNLYLFNQEQDRLKQITDRDWIVDSVKFESRNTIIFTANSMEEMGLNSNPEIFSVDLQTEKVKQLTTNLDKNLRSTVGNDCRYGGGKNMVIDDELLYFITTEGADAHLNYLEDHKINRLTKQSGSVDMFDVSDGQIAFIGFRDNKLQELYLLSDGIEKQISSFNENCLENKSLSQPEYFEVTASDGFKLDAWIMKPAGYQRGEEYPTILEIHGGPKTVYGTIFFHEFQVLANEGYVVVYCNPRGSDGRGNDFADIRGNYGNRDYQDLMEVMDTALDRFDFIDENKLGVGGGSYGGYMTNWIIGHSDRFQAAVSQRSIANWISMFGTTDIGYFFVEDQLKGTPWSDMQKLWDLSPLKYADKVNTPTLFIHSEEDYRCWLTEGLQMFTALKYQGVESRLCMFKGENHELSRSGKPKHRIKRLKEIVNWFNKYLK